MANPQLDQFMNALIWKAVPPIILCSIGALLLRELLHWIERKAMGAGGSRRAKRDAPQSTVGSSVNASAAAPRCPSCDGLMVKRTARRGANVGSDFWGCFGFPRCRGTRSI
jgi:Topoisomerase DNA binding C4 zinc finger